MTSRHALSPLPPAIFYRMKEGEGEFRWRVIYTGCVFNKVAIRISFKGSTKSKKFLEIDLNLIRSEDQLDKILVSKFYKYW